MDYTTALSNLNIDLGDSDNFTYTIEEKQRALTQAWDDPFNVSVAWDESLTYDSSTYTYTVPATIEYFKGLYYKSISTAFPKPLDSDAYTVVDGTIYINADYQYAIPNGATLCIKGTKQLTVADSLADNRVEYVLKLARYNTLSMLGGKKANKFLQNDTSMPEIMAIRQTLEKEIANMRRRFTQSVEVI
jgi:hypothetical protein